jgi:ankyrin repeat protein
LGKLDSATARIKNIERWAQQKKQNQKLFRAIEDGNLEEVQRLLADKESGASFNARNEDLQTPLHVAISEHQNEIARYLIYNGTDLRHRSLSEKSAFHIAAIRNNYKVALYMCQAYDVDIV